MVSRVSVVALVVFLAAATHAEKSGSKGVAHREEGKVKVASPGEDNSVVVQTVIDNMIQGTGDVVGSMYGNVNGKVVGQVKGTIIGTVTGFISGTVNGTQAQQDPNDTNGEGKTVTGTIQGAVAGTITGSATGLVSGSIDGEINGIATGLVNGSFDVVHNAMTLPGGAEAVAIPGVPRGAVKPGDSGRDTDGTQERMRKTVNAMTQTKIWCEVWRAESCEHCSFSFRGVAANPTIDKKYPKTSEGLNTYALTFTDRGKSAKPYKFKTRCMDEREKEDGTVSGGRSQFSPIHTYYPQGYDIPADAAAPVTPAPGAPWIMSHRVLTATAISIRLGFQSEIDAEGLEVVPDKELAKEEL